MISTKPFTEQTDEELAETADSRMGGNGGIVESVRRLREENRRLRIATYWLTSALIFFALVQTILLIPQIFHVR